MFARQRIGDNNGQATHGARKPPGPISSRRKLLYRGCNLSSLLPIVLSTMKLLKILLEVLMRRRMLPKVVKK